MARFSDISWEVLTFYLSIMRDIILHFIGEENTFYYDLGNTSYYDLLRYIIL